MWDTLSVVFFTAVMMLCGGMQLAVLPTYVHDVLGYGSFVAGSVISMQFLAAVAVRPLSSRYIDEAGAKRAVRIGFVSAISSGALLLLAALLQSWPVWSLSALFLSRIGIGASQALVGTGCLSWGIGLVGAANAARLISYNGVAAYAMIAFGAPLGIAIANRTHLGFLGFLIVLLSLLGLWLSSRKRPSAIVPGRRMNFMHVTLRIAPYGLGLGLGSIGFGALATFVTLYYASQGWADAAYCLTAFGVAFMAARILFAGSINRYGGVPVATVSFITEALGLLMLWLAWSPAVALLGSALTGFGLSLVYPALAVVAVTKVPVSNRGSALGAYSMFMDLSMGVAGPLLGALAAWAGYRSIFLLSAVLALASLALLRQLRRSATVPADASE